MTAAPDRFYWVDGLRGVAALCVVVFHYHHFYLADHTARDALPAVTEMPLGAWLWPIYDWGRIAVELFWVISGFVFAHVYLTRPTTARAFFAARIARLYPLHFVMLLVVAGLQMLSVRLAGHWQIYGNNDLWHFLLQLGLASNWSTLSYGLSFNGPIWSVSYEILVYVGFFAALGLIRRGGLWVSAGLAGLGWLLFALNFGPVILIRPAVFDCAGYFFLGAALYQLTTGPAAAPMARLALTGLAAALALGAALMGLERVALPAAATALILVATALDRSGWQPRPILAFFGNTSYSLYLVHVPLQMALLVLADAVWDGSRAFADHPILLPAYLAASLALAWMVYVWFEKPAGRVLRRWLSPSAPAARPSAPR